MDRVKALLIGLVAWYLGLFAWLAYSPVDRQFWAMASVLPMLFVIVLIASYRYVPLSPLSYILIMGFLTLHTVGVHYTYAQVPMGAWLNDLLHLGRNHFDRIVHFSFGFLLAYPMEETFRLLGHARGRVLYYLPVITVLGLSALWETLEAWVTPGGPPGTRPGLFGSTGRCVGRPKRYGCRYVRIPSVHGTAHGFPYPAQDFCRSRAYRGGGT